GGARAGTGARFRFLRGGRLRGDVRERRADLPARNHRVPRGARRRCYRPHRVCLSQVRSSQTSPCADPVLQGTHRHPAGGRRRRSGSRRGALAARRLVEGSDGGGREQEERPLGRRDLGRLGLPHHARVRVPLQGHREALLLRSVDQSESPLPGGARRRRGRVNLQEAVRAAGLDWEGRLHCGLDDARNTARLLAELMRRGVKITITGSLAAPPPPMQKQPAPYMISPCGGSSATCLCYCGLASRGDVMHGKCFSGCASWSPAMGPVPPYFAWSN
uniref:Exonuclease domain-containing protein n=1 Tax=Aegilops tauschii subsp. strangulata TaxID=200361 RepID=A0A453EKK1_AEGTS